MMEMEKTEKLMKDKKIEKLKMKNKFNDTQTYEKVQIDNGYKI